jgi:hypothetical protein
MVRRASPERCHFISEAAMLLIARARVAIARHPLLYWIAIVCCAVVAGLVAASAVHGVETQRQSWGSTRSVWVATSTHRAGDPLQVSLHEVPAAVVPDAVVQADPSQRPARQAIAAGEVITEFDVAGEGVLALVPDDAVALAVATATGAVFQLGDPVVVFETGQLLAAGTIVAVADEAVMVAVPRTAAGAVGRAALDGTAVIGLSPPVNRD